MMRQLRADIAELLQNGQHKAALSRTVQLHKDELKLSAYDQVDKFCDCVVKNLKDIRPDRKLPVDVCEAISSLIFAASRCGELPELHSLRYLFKGLLGPQFERANVELLPGNTVNSLIKQSLVVKSVAEDVKIQLINDIARDYKQDIGPLSNDGANGIKDQTRPKKFEEMLPDIGPKLALQDCKDMVTFWSNFPDKIPRSPIAHVHPKLPDYDDLVVQFGNLKKEYMQKISNK
ncbi:unnamed protein product [Coffea canephora]|uniref:Uncharacterized protein n=1 Tax=Coffea canephora TaxID=49390 RepID=A0A068UCF7_COFCA|nr:unnamed protein product [Coffea canephora]